MKNWLKIFLILFIGFLIIFWILAYELFRWNSFSGNILSIRESYIHYQAEKKDETISCNSLKNIDTKILNNSFWIAWFSWWIDYWCNLQVLEIPNQEVIIPDFPKEIWKLINLKKIGIRETKSKAYIPKEIWNLKKLKILELWNSNLSWKIPEELYTLKNLQILSINSNNINWTLSSNNINWKLSPKIWNLINLVILKITKSNIEWKIPKSIWNLKKLLVLDLHWNKLTWEIPKEIQKLDKLITLFLYDNNFTNKNIKENLIKNNKLENILK